MNKILTMIFACGCSGILFVECHTSADQGTVQSSGADTAEVFQLKKETGIKELSLPAELLPWEVAELHAKVGGYVKSVLVDIGDRVRKYQALVILDAPEVTADYAKSRADLAAAMAKYNMSKDNYDRLKNAAAEKGAVSELELKNFYEKMRSDSGALEAARAAAVAFGELNNYLVIRAPFAGTVTMREADPGILAGPNSGPLLKIENLEKLRIQTWVPETYAAFIHDNNEIRFRVNAEPDKTYMGIFSRKAGSLDAETRTETWEFICLNPDGNLKPGLITQVDLRLKRREPVFIIPFTALVTNLERSFVIRVNRNTAEWVDVKNGISFSDKIEIFGLLQEGDLLILRANDEIRPGKEIYALKK